MMKTTWRAMIEHSKGWFRRWIPEFSPGNHAWTGASLGLLAGAIIFVLVATWADFGGTDVLGLLIGLVVFLLGGAMAGLAAWLAQRILVKLPGRYLAALAGALTMFWLTLFVARVDLVGFLLIASVVLSLIGAAFWGFVKGSWGRVSPTRRVILAIGIIVGLVSILAGGAWLFGDGASISQPVNAARLSGDVVSQIEMPDPSQPGLYSVHSLTYGSGADLHRAEFGEEADLISTPVDGSLLVDGWSGLRRDYWGFGPQAMPLNGRVWYPQGAGPFPIVLIVHGNHIAEFYSDTGYDYLGEIIASQGMIAVSIDENFLNLSPSANMAFISSLQEENDARGWLLLQHLRTWRQWNAEPGNPFYGKVDLEQVGLIGHSRGGEAVAIAAQFNQLPYYPDNANLAFDFGFGIRAVAAIAPIDGGYHAGGRAISPENISYFTLHGTHDMDATVFEGRWMYERVAFTDEAFHFKSALYIYGANHGQFNSEWGRSDLTYPGMWFYNLRNLMPVQDQQRVAQVYLTAFMQATLQDQRGYLPLFRDARFAGDWLPDTIYLNQYFDSRTLTVASFEEDLDITSATLPDARVWGENLQSWFEQRIYTKNRNQLLSTAAYLRWAPEMTETAGAAFFSIFMPEGGLALNGRQTLVFTLSDASPADNPAPEPVDLTVELVDQAGQRASLLLSRCAFIQPRLQAHIFKTAWMSKLLASEMVFRDFELNLVDFIQVNSAFDPGRLAEIRLVFDRTPKGAIAVDSVSFR